MAERADGASGEWSRFRAAPALGVEGLHARFVSHRYERHTHDFYLLAAVEAGAPVVAGAHGSFVTPAGAAMAINPGEEHDGRAVDAAGYVYRTLYIAPRVVSEVAAELTGDDRLIDFASSVVEDPRVVTAVREVHRALFAGEDRLLQEQRLLRVLELMVGSHSGLRLPRLPAQVDARVSTVRDQIHARYGDSLTTADLAVTAGLSRVRINQLFQRAYGLPLHAYVNGVRLRQARTLLRSGMPPAAVAASVGFTDQSHLNRRFKGSFGITPGQFVIGHLPDVQDRTTGSST